MTIKELYDNFYESNTPRNPRLFVDYYEKNYVIISNTDLSNLIDYDLAMRLTCDYAISLESLGYLKKGVEYLDKAISLMENFPNYEKEKLFEIYYYESLIFHKARALYNMKKYKESLIYFNQLDKAYPDNDKYSGWLIGLKYKKFEIFSWIGTIMMLIVLLVRIFFKGNNPTFDYVTLWLLPFSFLLFAIPETIRQFLKYKLKKINAT